MRVGTKSLLFGAHQFVLDPLYVALSWRELYGEWPGVRESLAIAVHDWGYFGCPDMDGEHGKFHPGLGARIMGSIFGSDYYSLSAGHSRTYSEMMGIKQSKLAAPDKLAMAKCPAWLYDTLVALTGEWEEYYEAACEYMAEAGVSHTSFMMAKMPGARLTEWAAWCRCHLRRQAHELARPYTTPKPPCSPDPETTTLLRPAQGPSSVGLSFHGLLEREMVHKSSAAAEAERVEIYADGRHARHAKAQATRCHSCKCSGGGDHPETCCRQHAKPAS